MTPSQALRAAKAKLSDPARWCKGCFARDKYGCQTNMDSVDAVQWCAVGATGPGPDGCRADLFLHRAAVAIGVVCVSLFNDAPATEHRHILGLFDWAIALAERDEA